MPLSAMASNRNLGTILVTGGGGWLGSHIVERLVSDSQFSAIVSTLEPNVVANRRVPGATYHVCDISNAKEFVKLLNLVKPRVIMHTVGPGFFAPPEAHYRVTYDLSRQLVAIARKHSSVQALVYTCTAEAVRMTPEMNSSPLKEEDATIYNLSSGPNAYARTKSAVDALVRESNTPEALDNNTGNYQNQLLTTVLRVTGLYGPRDRLTIGEILLNVNTSKSQFQIGPNELVHDFIHVDNCALAHVLAAQALLNPKEERADGQAIFVSDGKPKKFWDFVHKIYELGGDANWAPNGPRKSYQIPFWLVVYPVVFLEWLFWAFTFGKLRPNSNSTTFEYMKTGCWFDIGKAKRALGYEPMFDTDEGLKRAMQWFRANEGWEKKNM